MATVIGQITKKSTNFQTQIYQNTPLWDVKDHLESLYQNDLKVVMCEYLINLVTRIMSISKLCVQHL